MISFENYNKMVNDLKAWRKETGENSSSSIIHFVMTRLNKVNEEEVQQPLDVEDIRARLRWAHGSPVINWTVDKCIDWFLPYLQQAAPQPLYTESLKAETLKEFNVDHENSGDDDDANIINRANEYRREGALWVIDKLRNTKPAPQPATSARWKVFRSKDGMWHRLVQFDGANHEQIKALCAPHDPFQVSKGKVGDWVYEVPEMSPRSFVWVSETYINDRGLEETSGRDALSGGNKSCNKR